MCVTALISWNQKGIIATVEQGMPCNNLPAPLAVSIQFNPGEKKA
jgi:hypothetical protein